MGLTSFPNGISSNGVPIYGNGNQDISGTTYFVDNNSGLDSNDGSSWEKAFKTFAKATAISNINIASSSSTWARRNTIYYAADTETATIVAFPNKCDVIGVGSYDANKKPGISGLHAPVNAGNMGTRFINMWFKATAVDSPIITLASTSSGLEFYGCMFDGVVGTVTSGILATAAPNLKVVDCDFIGAFATSYISFGTGAMLKVDILNNRMYGAAVSGIVVASDTTTTYGGLIKGNFIQAAGVTIDDDSDTFYVVDNYLVSAAGHGVLSAGNIDVNLARACGNTITGSDVTYVFPQLGTGTT